MATTAFETRRHEMSNRSPSMSVTHEPATYHAHGDQSWFSDLYQAKFNHNDALSALLVVDIRPPLVGGAWAQRMGSVV